MTGVQTCALPISLENLKEVGALAKAISAGGYDVAPTSLTGGSALQVEDVDSGNHKLRNMGLAAVRDWNRKGDFRKFLKARLPDASDKFLNHFIDLMDDFHVKKAEELEANLAKALEGLHKAGPAEPIALEAAPPVAAKPTLAPLNREAPQGTHEFRGQHVTPGEVQLLAGPYAGSMLHLVGSDNNHFYVKPTTANPDSPTQITKLPASDFDKTFRVNRQPVPTPSPVVIHAEEHGHPVHTKSFEQQALMHGIDLSQKDRKSVV